MKPTPAMTTTLTTTTHMTMAIAIEGTVNRTLLPEGTVSRMPLLKEMVRSKLGEYKKKQYFPLIKEGPHDVLNRMDANSDLTQSVTW